MKIYSNKNSFFLLLFVVFLSACDALKQVQSTGDNTTRSEQEELEEIEGKRVYNQDSGSWEVVTDVTGEMEDVKWEEAPNAAPPISSEATENGTVITPELGDPIFSPEPTNMLPFYKMVLALPFMTHQNYSNDAKINPKSIPALNFYEGAKMALEVLEAEEVNLQVEVLDTKAEEANTQLLTQQGAMYGAHVIIGTFRNSTANVMASFAQTNKIPFVSPYYPHNALVENNPYFIQLNPSVFTHTKATMDYLKTRYSEDQIVLIGRKTRRDQGMINLYQKAHYGSIPDAQSFMRPLKQVIIEDQTSSLEDTDIKQYFVKGRPTVFVVASSQENFVYAVLRKIDIEKKNFEEDNKEVILDEDEVMVFGQPRWKDFTKISYDYYEKLNLHITSESFLDPETDNVKAFRKHFFNKYKALPTDEAYKGFDTVLYFGRQLKEKGTGFYSTLDQSPGSGLHTQFNIERTVTQDRTTGEENLDAFDQQENKKIHVLEFRDFHFIKVN